MKGLINRTRNGQVFMCSTCKKIHIEFKNLNFNFTEEQYDEFSAYIQDLNGSVWERHNSHSHFHRKIIIPINHDCFRVLLDQTELIELKSLLQPTDKPQKDIELIKTKDFEFVSYLN